MIDAAPAAIAAVMHGDVAKFPLMTLAGLATSVGPCIAPRYVALASVLNGPRRAVGAVSFIAGLVTVYTALGFGVGLFGSVLRHAAALDAVLAVALVVGGVVTLVRGPQCHHDSHENDRPFPRSSGIFCLGAASALVISPCCTPVVAAVATFPSLDPSPWTRATLLAAFAVGHAAPLVLLGFAGTIAGRTLQRLNASPAPVVISGTLMLALGAYYGALV